MQNYLLTNLGATERLFYSSQNVEWRRECIRLTQLYIMVIYFCSEAHLEVKMVKN